jgi:hypothetical protein
MFFHQFRVRVQYVCVHAFLRTSVNRICIVCNYCISIEKCLFFRGYRFSKLDFELKPKTWIKNVFVKSRTIMLRRRPPATLAPIRADRRLRTTLALRPELRQTRNLSWKSNFTVLNTLTSLFFPVSFNWNTFCQLCFN